MDSPIPRGLLIERIAELERDYVEQVLRTGFSSSHGAAMTGQLERAFADYECFLRLVFADGGAREPTALVDLIWHTHMQSPLHYAADCLRIAGGFVDHHDELLMD